MTPSHPATNRAVGVFFLKACTLLGFLCGDLLHDTVGHAAGRGRMLVVWCLVMLWAFLVFARDLRRAIEDPPGRYPNDPEERKALQDALHTALHPPLPVDSSTSARGARFH